MWNAKDSEEWKCRTTVIGPQVRPQDHSCYTVDRIPLVAGAAVNCVMQMWKVAFYACYRNLDLPFAINWKMLRNDINKNYCCVWRYCRYPQGLQSIIHHAKHASVPITSRCSVEDGWMNYCSSFWHRSFHSPIVHCVKRNFRYLQK